MASENITFKSIPSSIRKPGQYFELNTELASRGLPNNKQRMLIIGQRLTSGSVAQAVPTQVFSDVEAAAYFGYGSIAHLMVRAALKANSYLDLTVCALDDSASTPVARVHTLTIANAATSSGTLTLYVGNVRYQVGIASGDAAATIATALKASLDNDAALPFTVTLSTATLTFTAKNKGTVANQIDFETAITATGTTATLTATTAGSVDPDITTALTVVFAEQYNIIACPLNDSTSLAALKTYLDNVSGPMEQRPGIGVFGYDGTLANCTTLTISINSGRMLCAYLRGTRSPAYELGAAMAAVIASEEDPAMPLNTLPLTGIAVPPITQRLSRTEQENLLYNGVTPVEVGPGEVAQIVRAVTTYIHNASGIDDPALLDLMKIRIVDYFSKACRERVALRFPRSKLSAKTPDAIHDQLEDVSRKCEDLEIIENVDLWLPHLIVERDLQDSERLNARIPCDAVNGLHIFAGRIDLYL